MKLKIPPVIVVAICAVSMWLLDQYILSSYAYVFPHQRTISTVAFVSCMLFMMSSMYAFRKHRTTFDPTSPDKASSLVQGGVFNLSRNPMYVSMLLLLIGWAVKLGNPFSVLILILFVWYMTQFQINAEEEALMELFGAEYKAFCKRVRRWL
jgi:protein-S-isoprenylcysteine O-methyltransferase Ste14